MFARRSRFLLLSFGSKKGEALRREAGAAALEYILVTTFAAVVTMAALVYIGHAVQDQLTRFGERLGLQETPNLDLPFGEH